LSQRRRLAAVEFRILGGDDAARDGESAVQRRRRTGKGPEQHVGGIGDVADLLDLFAEDAEHQGANLFLGLHINDVLKGFWMFLSRSYDILEVHTCLLPEARGDIATKGAPAALRHVFTSTPTMTLVTHVPTPNHAAHKFASWVGFKTLHTIKDAWRKDGKTSDVEVMCFSVFDWFRCLTGDAPSRARYLISALAMNGQFPKAAYLHTYFTTLLGDLGST